MVSIQAVLFLRFFFLSKIPHFASVYVFFYLFFFFAIKAGRKNVKLFHLLTSAISNECLCEKKFWVYSSLFLKWCADWQPSFRGRFHFRKFSLGTFKHCRFRQSVSHPRLMRESVLNWWNGKIRQIHEHTYFIRIRSQM